MDKHFGKTIMAQILQMKKQDMTHHSIGEEFGLTKTQIKKLVERYNRKNRSSAIGPKRRGRPRKHPLRSEQDYIERIKQLEMQVELYRPFRQAVGRM